MIDKPSKVKGAFRFTEWQMYQHQCDDWLEWFRRKRKPAAIVQNEENRQSFAVFKGGFEYRSKESEYNPELFIPMKMSVVDSVNGFKLKFE